MRNAFVETLIELAQDDERVFLLTADLGWSVLEPFAEAYPQRFLNVGVAEANMAGIATGLAQLGYTPYIYSIATFTSMRCYEQIRNGPVLHGLPVRVIGVGGGYAYGHAGSTHHALEDLVIHATQPDMTVLIPADPAQTRTLVRAAQTLQSSAYLRVGKGGNPEVPGLQGRFELGQVELVREGADLLILACGATAAPAAEACEQLQQTGLRVSLGVVAQLGAGMDRNLSKHLSAHRSVMTVEEGYLSGGLGAQVARLIATTDVQCRLRCVGVEQSLSAAAGSAGYLRKQNGLDAHSLAATARAHLASDK